MGGRAPGGTDQPLQEAGGAVRGRREVYSGVSAQGSQLWEEMHGGSD